MTHLEEYNRIIESRKSNPLPEEQYGEDHHIVPKSICPILKDSKDNIVRLSAQEHFLAHYHLWLAYRDELHEKKWAKKMCWALTMMKRQLMQCDDIDVMSKLYEEARIGMSNQMRGHHHSKETREKISKASIGNKSALGICHSEEARRKNAEAHKGNKYALGHHLKADVRHKLSDINTGCHFYNNGIKMVYTRECPAGFIPGMLKRCK